MLTHYVCFIQCRWRQKEFSGTEGTLQGASADCGIRVIANKPPRKPDIVASKALEKVLEDRKQESLNFLSGISQSVSQNFGKLMFKTDAEQ